MSDTSATKSAPSKNALTNCHCLTGTDKTCSATTRKAFAQGHDARMSSRIATLIATDQLTSEQGVALIRQAGGGDLLVSKTVHSAKLRKSKGNGEQAPKAHKKATEPEMPKSPTVVGKSTKVYHGKRPFNAVVVRNASDELKARHRLNSQNCDHEVEVGEDGEIFTK